MSRIHLLRRMLLLSSAALGFAALLPALHAQSAPSAAPDPPTPGPRYAIASVLGEDISVVGAQPTVGTSLDRNQQTRVPLPDGGLDNALMLMTERLLRTQCRRCTASFLRVDPAALGVPALSLTDAALAPALEAARASGADRLLLLSPHRGEPELQTSRGAVGHGHVQGLGFYLDRTYKLRRSDTGELAQGFLGAFANFRVQVIDVASGKTLLNEAVRTGTTRSAARAADGDPWQAIPDDRKVSFLVGLVRMELQRLPPPVVAQPG
ncbi:hypothetical protein IP84_04080 [beta proteobacterium AAP99]|nr:hypothetical protein IP84_04080 [beta proteobacterium AAP99]